MNNTKANPIASRVGFFFTLVATANVWVLSYRLSRLINEKDDN